MYTRIVCLALVVGLASRAAAQTFHPFQSHAVGGSPRGVAVGDFDGDGLQDVAVALFYASAVEVLPGTSTGLGAPVPYAVPVRPARVAAGDVDGDGDLDLAVVHQSLSHTVTLLLGNGDGTFAASTAGPFVPAAPSDVALADFDGDGRADLLVGAAGATAHLYRALGGGAFGPATSLDFSGTFDVERVVDIAVGDLDGDGDLDAVLAAQDDGTEVVVNQGGFAFTHHAQGGWWGDATLGVDLADGNQDGKLDLVWVESDAIDTEGDARPGLGGGTFGAPQIAIFGSLEFVRWAHLDLDADPDYLGGLMSGLLRWNFGAGGLGATIGGSVNVSGTVRAMEAFDLDGDGFDEVVVTDSANDRIVLLRNVGCPAPATIVSATPHVAPSVAAPATALRIEGCDLDAVTSVVVGGASAAFAVSPNGRKLVATLPQGLALGSATVELHGASGVLSSTVVDVAAAAQPVLALEPAGDLSVQDPALPHVGGAPGDLAFLFVSPGNGPSTLPGVLDLAIGDGFASLFLLATAPLAPATASTALPLVAPPGLVGATFHFQAAVLDAATFAFPLEATNVVSATVVP